MLETMLQDLRYSVRTLIARPGFTAAVLLTLALAIGANTLVFSLIDAIYLRPLPYRDDAALIDLSNDYAKSGPIHAGVSIPDYLDRRQAKSLADSALYTDASVNLSIDERPVRLHALRTTPSLFSTLGVGAAIGRTFTDDEATDGRDKVVVINYALWQSRFAGDPAAVGRELRLNDETYRIVGVMPPGFMFPDRDTTLYIPFVFTEKQKTDRERGHEFSGSVARVAPGATSATVKAECDAIIARNAERIGATGEDGASFSRFVKASGFTAGILDGAHARHRPVQCGGRRCQHRPWLCREPGPHEPPREPVVFDHQDLLERHLAVTSPARSVAVAFTRPAGTRRLLPWRARGISSAVP